jgi:hypothetical protein
MTNAPGDPSPESRYRALPSRLAETADAAIAFFKRNFGISGFQIEEAIHPEASYRPTLSKTTREQEIVCVEVSDTAYPRALDQLVLDCQSLMLPVKIYVVMPKGAEDPAYRENTTRARKFGVGLVEVDGKGGTVVHEAVSLFLMGVRPIEKSQFPARHRARLVVAETAYRSGAPDKGCSILYDEIEAATRVAGKKALERGAWTKATPAGHVPRIDLLKGPWANVIATMRSHCDFKKVGCPKLTDNLLMRVAGHVDRRNELGHKPKKRAERVKRDTKLRTWFEEATDLLQELLDAARHLRL